MNSVWRALTSLLAILPMLGCQGSRSRTTSADIVLRGVTVLSPADGSLAPGQTVSINDGCITAVTPDADAVETQNTRTVDGTGLFLMPGLWDFHTHLSLADPNAAALMVTQGVTGARDLGGILEEIDALRDRILRDEQLGPSIVRVGPTLNGAQYAPHQRVIDSPAAARQAVADLAAKRVDLLKTHNATERGPYFALLDAASDAGLDVVGHIPVAVSPLEACEAGQASIDHIVTIFEGVYLAGFTSEAEAMRSVDAWFASDAAALVNCFARHGTLFVPTLRTYEFRAHRAALYDDPPAGWQYLTRENRVAFRELRVPSDRDRDAAVIALRESVVSHGQRLTRLLYEAGAPIGAGSDFAGPGLVPGFSIHRELELLVGAGLPAHAAIWAAARGPGERAGADPLTGRIEAGAPADLVLLRSNPFERIEALSSIEAVVVRGRLLDRAALDSVLATLSSE